MHRRAQAARRCRAASQQLFINPDQCVDCGACQPECPWEAIFPEDDVPAPFTADIALNAISGVRPEEFEQAPVLTKRAPADDEVEANKRRWTNDH